MTTVIHDYRVVCSGVDSRKFHDSHQYFHETLHDAERRVSFLHVQKWTESCRPFRIERREVGPWVPFAEVDGQGLLL